MYKLFYLMTFLGSLDPTYERASDYSRRALLAYPEMKKEMKELENTTEKHLYDWTGLKKDDLVYAAYAYPLVAGKISSKPFKNFKYTTKERWTIRPEIEYELKSKSYSGYLSIIKEF